jgi:hypothetical protein
MAYQCGIFAVLQQDLNKVCRTNKSERGFLYGIKFKYVEAVY